MTLAIAQSTSFVVIFKAYLASDHVSEATGKTIAITISKNGGAFGNPNAGATNATEISSGWYKVTLDTTDTGTLGPIAVRGAVATVDDVGMWYQVVKATNGGMTALPDTACTTNASLLTSGTGTAQISNSSGQVILQAGSGTGQLDFTSGVVKANVTQFGGSNGTFASGLPDVNTQKINSVATTSVTTINANVGTTQPCNYTGTGASALMKSDMVDVAGSAVSTTSAQLGVNVVNVNAVSAASVTTVSANLGTTQPVNFTGTGASALAKSDMVDVAGSAVSASTAQLGVNVVNFGGSAGTFASGRPETNTTHIAGSAVNTSSAQLGVNVVNAAGTAWGSGAITAASIATDAITAAKIAADAIGASELAADAVTEIAAGVLTTAMTESYAANGVAPTLTQAMYAMHQYLMDFGISSTSYTVKKLDNSTTAFVVTLNSATTPTAAART